MGIKFMSINKYEPFADEKRLEEFAAGGEFITSQGAGLAFFKKSEPKKMRYSIEASTAMPSKKKRQAYKESGWDFAARGASVNIYCTEDENAVPLHTDRSEYAHVIEEFHRSSFKSFLVVLIISALAYIGSFIFLNALDFSVIRLIDFDFETEKGMLISSAVAIIFISSLLIGYLIDVIRAGQFIAGCIESRKAAAKSLAVNIAMISCTVLMIGVAAADNIFQWHCAVTYDMRDGSFGELPSCAITSDDFVSVVSIEEYAAEKEFYADSTLRSYESGITNKYYSYYQFAPYRKGEDFELFPVHGYYFEFKNTLTAKIAVEEFAGFDAYSTNFPNSTVTQEYNAENTPFDRIISVTNTQWEDVTFFLRQGKVVQCISVCFNEDFPDTESCYQKIISIT